MPDIEISKIILRRGPAFDLPGKPVKLNPRQWTRPLDEGELAFAEDQGRIFIGADPARHLKQSTRLPFPYQNVEVIGENSVEAFADMHGARMREGDERDYYSAPLFKTTPPASQLVIDRFTIEDMPGYVRYGVEQQQPIISGEGTPAKRDVSATKAQLLANGNGELSTPLRSLLINDFARNRIVSLSTGTADATSYVHTVEVRDTYGSFVASYAVADVGAAHNPLFTPSVYTADGKLAGVIATKGKKGLGIYDERGNPVSIPVVAYGTYDSFDNETDLTDTVSIPGNVPINLGPVTYNGTDYYCFGNGAVSVGTVGNYVIASCATSRGQSVDPASFLVFTTEGVYCGKIEMPAAYNASTVYKWVKAGTRTIGFVKPNSSSNQTHFLVFTPGSGTVNIEVKDAYLTCVNALGSLGGIPVIDYAVYVPRDDSMLVFSHTTTTISGETGSYSAVVKIKLSDWSVLWTKVSAFVSDDLPQISNLLWSTPIDNAMTFADRILGDRYKWLSPIGFHEIDLNSGSIKCAAWSETDVVKPSNNTFNLSPAFYDEAQDRIVFGGGTAASIDQYTFLNLSTDATGSVTVEFHGPNFVLGGDEYTSKLGELTSPNGARHYIVNVNANRWVAVYDAATLDFVKGWDGGGTTQIGGSIVPCTNGLTLIPIQDGRLLRITANNSGVVSFSIIDCIEETTSFGVFGMYVHDASDNSLVVIGGPENSTTQPSFKWLIDSETIKWGKTYSGPFTDTGNDGVPIFGPCASQIINGGFLGFVNSYGGVSLINLANGERVYKGVAETTSGFDTSMPWTNAQWSWESETNTLMLVNTTSQFSANDPNRPIAEQLAEYSGSEAYLKSGTVNYHVDLIKLRFKRNSGGLWSTEVSRPATVSDPFAPDMRMWVDYTRRFAYMASNKYLKCYDLDTLELVATAQSGIGRGVLKLWGINATGKLYMQLGTHDGMVSDTEISYSNDRLYMNRQNSYKTYVPLLAVNVFGNHLVQGNQWRTVFVDANPATPFEIHDIDTVNLFVDYTIVKQNGERVRYGKQQVQYYYNPLALPGEPTTDPRVSMVDEAEQLILQPESDPVNFPIYDPSTAANPIGFRYILVEEGPGEPVLRLQYRNFTSEMLSMQWKVSRPPIPVATRAKRGYISSAEVGISGNAVAYNGVFEESTFTRIQLIKTNPCDITGIPQQLIIQPPTRQANMRFTVIEDGVMMTGEHRVNGKLIAKWGNGALSVYVPLTLVNPQNQQGWEWYVFARWQDDLCGDGNGVRLRDEQGVIRGEFTTEQYDVRTVDIQPIEYHGGDGYGFSFRFNQF